MLGSDQLRAAVRALYAGERIVRINNPPDHAPVATLDSHVPHRPFEPMAALVALAGIVMDGYACIAGLVFVLWGSVGFFVPGIDYLHPTLARQVPVLVAGRTGLNVGDRSCVAV